MKSLIKSMAPNFLVEMRRERMSEAVRQRQAQSVTMSQAGQDFWVYAEVFNEKRNGFFLDIGAHDGIHLSNSFLLEQRYGWKGICIEGNPRTYEQLKVNRSCVCVNRCVDMEKGMVKFALRGVMGGIVAEDCDNSEKGDVEYAEVESLPLVDILKEHNAPANIDYLSIDIEGAEDRALLSFPFDQYQFSCLTIERPSAALRARFEEFDYLLIKEIPGLDCFYLHRSLEKEYFTTTIAFFEKKFQRHQWR